MLCSTGWPQTCNLPESDAGTAALKGFLQGLVQGWLVTHLVSITTAHLEALSTPYWKVLKRQTSPSSTENEGNRLSGPAAPCSVVQHAHGMAAGASLPLPRHALSTVPQWGPFSFSILADQSSKSYTISCFPLRPLRPPKNLTFHNGPGSLPLSPLFVRGVCRPLKLSQRVSGLSCRGEWG